MEASINVWSLGNWLGSLFRLFAAVFRKKTESTAENVQVGQTAERLLKEYGNHVLRLAYSYLHNMQDAEDILQETLIRYLQSAPDFQSSEHEKAWLLRVAANLSKNRIDYNRLRETDELDEKLQAEEREDLAFVWEAVRDLPENYREVIHLYYYEGYSTKEIAKLLQSRESTVRSNLKRGREKLKAILKGGVRFWVKHMMRSWNG